jgi:hypothetical protein
MSYVSLPLNRVSGPDGVRCKFQLQARPVVEPRGRAFHTGHLLLFPLTIPFHLAVEQNMIAQTVLWIYIVLLIASGVAGIVKGKSKATLAVAVAFAVGMSLCALHVVSYRWTSWMLLALLVIFAVQLGRTKKLMPAGLMLILTALALALPHLPFR